MTKREKAKQSNLDETLASLDAAQKRGLSVRSGDFRPFDGVSVKGKSITETLLEARGIPVSPKILVSGEQGIKHKVVKDSEQIADLEHSDAEQDELIESYRQGEIPKAALDRDTKSTPKRTRNKNKGKCK